MKMRNYPQSGNWTEWPNCTSSSGEEKRTVEELLAGTSGTKRLGRRASITFSLSIPSSPVPRSQSEHTTQRCLWSGRCECIICRSERDNGAGYLQSPSHSKAISASLHNRRAIHSSATSAVYSILCALGCRLPQTVQLDVVSEHVNPNP